MLRMMYAMAIMRLVNGVVDQSQKRNTTSVALRAEAAELPRVLVDIRHEAAHNELPSLPLLQHGSKKALDWLLSHYWDAQQQALRDAKTLLRLKLVQHSEMVHKVLQPPPPPQQPPLVSEEVEKGEKRSRKQLKKKSKEALRSAKQRQRVVFRELLELAQFAVCDVVALLVNSGLLLSAHDDDDACQTITATMILSASAADGNGDDDNEIVNNLTESPLPSANVGTTSEIQRSTKGDETRTAAWKQTIRQLSSHMPQLPILLLVAIVERLAGSSRSSRYNNNNNNNDDISRGRRRSWSPPRKRAKPSSPPPPTAVLDSSVARERFLEWATWILNEEAVPFSSDGFCSRTTTTSGLLSGSSSAAAAARIGSRRNNNNNKIRESVALSKELARELVGTCLRSGTMDKFLRMRLVLLLAQYFGNSSYARRAARLAGLGGGDALLLLKEEEKDSLSKGGVYGVELSDASERDDDVRRNTKNSSLLCKAMTATQTTTAAVTRMTTAAAMLSPELAVKEAKQQQEVMLNRPVVACAVLAEEEEEGHVQSAAAERRRSRDNNAAAAGQLRCKTVAGWRPCAVGMLPSSVDCMGAIPKFSADDDDNIGEDDNDVLTAVKVTKGRKVLGKVLGIGKDEEEDRQATAAATVKDSETASTQTTHQHQHQQADDGEETVSFSCKKRKEELESRHADDGHKGPSENDDTAKRRRRGEAAEEMKEENGPVDNKDEKKWPRWPGIFLLQRDSLEPHIVEELHAAICLL